MNNNSGFLYIVSEPARAASLKDIILEKDTFTDAISSKDEKPKDLELCLLSFDSKTLAYVALARRGHKVATLKYSVRFSDFVDLGQLSFAMVKRKIDSNFKSHFLGAYSGLGGRIPHGTWNALIACIKRIVPNVATELDRLELKRRQKHKSYTGHVYDLLAMEKDATSLALDIFDVERSRILETWNPSQNLSAPFIAGLYKFKLREDAIIAKDSRIFGDWVKKQQEHITGAIEFTRDDEKLTILNVNRTPIEKTLGVDLLYYHHRYKSFVLVQYKRMEKEGNSSELGFRPVGKQYGKELSRMRQFKIKHSDNDSSSFDNYRLNPEAFYLKLCPSVVFNSLKTELLMGMYWPLDAWDSLLGDSCVKGRNGGIRITYKNAGRSINNSLFVQLVQDGWIGSRGVVSDALNYVTRMVLAGRSVTVALTGFSSESNNDIYSAECLSREPNIEGGCEE